MHANSIVSDSKEASFFIKYRNFASWDTHIRFAQPMQDAMDLRSYIMDRIHELEHRHHISNMLNDQTRSIGVIIQNFIKDYNVPYTLFDGNRMQFDKVRKVMYHIKDGLVKTAYAKQQR